MIIIVKIHVDTDDQQALEDIHDDIIDIITVSLAAETTQTIVTSRVYKDDDPRAHK